MSRGRSIVTRTGKMVRPLDLKPEDVNILDVAWSLAGEGRFTNHSKDTHSVAQHSVLMAQWARQLGLPWHVQYQCLLHDATEAYFADVSKPIKELFPDYEAGEHKCWQAIAAALHCPADMDPMVKELDRKMLRAELRQVMPPYQTEVAEEEGDAYPGRLWYWTRAKAFKEFLIYYSLLRPAEAPVINIKMAERILLEAGSTIRPLTRKAPVAQTTNRSKYSHQLTYSTRAMTPGETVTRKFPTLVEARRFKQGLLTAGGTAERILPIRSH